MMVKKMELNQNSEMVTISKSELQFLKENCAKYNTLYSNLMNKLSWREFREELLDYQLEIVVKLNNDAWKIYDIPGMDNIINEFHENIDNAIQEYLEESENEIEIEFETYKLKLIE